MLWIAKEGSIDKKHYENYTINHMAKVIIYTTPTCVYCKSAKAFFKDNNIAYEEKDVSKDVQARDEMIKKSGMMAVPVIDIDGSVTVGFDRAKLSQLLGIK